MSQNQDQSKNAPNKKEERIRGVFSSQEVRVVGTGTTRRRSIHKVFWFVEQDNKGTIQVQSINNNYVPTGVPKKISMEELLERYSPEPEFYIQSVFPKIRELNESVRTGDKCREKGENFSAEFAYDKALKLDEENIRANFGIGLTYLSRGDVDKADNIFERLVHLDAAFEEQHKHLFNDFGINLRKNKMYKQAEEYYTRALELSHNDENIHINLARALFEGEDRKECVAHLLEALRISPHNETALKFLDWMNQKRIVPPEFRRHVEAALRSAPIPETPVLNTPVAPANQDTPGGSTETATVLLPPEKIDIPNDLTAAPDENTPPSDDSPYTKEDSEKATFAPKPEQLDPSHLADLAPKRDVE